MYLPNMLSSGLIRVNVEARDKWSLIEELSGLLALSMPLANGEPLGKDEIYRAVLDQEQRRTSALGLGCALPHARIEGLAKPVACLATLSKGIEFDAIDHEPVRIVCLMLAPLEDPSVALKVMAEVASIMVDDTMRAKVEQAEDGAALHALLRELDTGEEHTLRARNIMRKPYYTIYPETPITEVTRLLAEHNLEATSVVDATGRIVGIVTCDQIFRSGLPEFFGQLKSVAFIKRFDPFESYFKSMKTATAGDIMTSDFSALPEDATLLEVIFELSVHRHPKIFVVRDGILCGIIDRIAVLNRVLNY
jgi:PTS system nitrogen regulatory IIA component